MDNIDASTKTTENLMEQLHVVDCSAGRSTFPFDECLIPGEVLTDNELSDTSLAREALWSNVTYQSENPLEHNVVTWVDRIPMCSLVVDS